MSEGNTNYPKSFKFGEETFKLLFTEQDIAKGGKVFFCSDNYLASYTIGEECIAIIPNDNADRVFLLEFNPVSNHFTTLEFEGIGTFYKVHGEDKYVDSKDRYELISQNFRGKITLRPSSVDTSEAEVYWRLENNTYSNLQGKILEICFTPVTNVSIINVKSGRG
jgi:hypothetical protein